MRMRIALVVMLVAGVAAATAAAGTKARVVMTTTAPATVHGTNFRARERVKVTVAAESTRTMVVTANARGVFTAKFAHFAIGYCVGYVITAKGNHGSFATLKVTPDCPPPATG